MTRTVTLRAWKKAALEAFAAARGPDFLSVATPGAGNTTFALTAARQALAAASPVPDYQYTHGDALRDGRVVRPVYFPRIDGMMEWSAPEGTLHAHSVEAPLEAARASQRPRTAYSLDGEWLPHVLRQGHEQLLGIRRRHPDAGAP